MRYAMLHAASPSSSDKSNVEVPHAEQMFITRKRQRLAVFIAQRHCLRVAASNVAAVTGFHPWKNLPELILHDLVYQGDIGKELLRQDAAVLGLTLVAPDDALKGLAQKAGAAAVSAVRDALCIKQGITVLHSVQAATAVKTNAVNEAAKVLSKTELRLLKEGVRSAVDTGYGTAHEDDALDLYQKQTGWPVEERNAEVRDWPFGLVDDESVGPTVAPLRPASAFWRHDKRPNVVKDVTDNIADACNFSMQSKDLDLAEPIIKGLIELVDTEYPFFSIVGSVDGIREELAPTLTNINGTELADDDSWVLRKVIVECKHRMHRIQPTPPLYEQIQTVTYCLMYRVDDADIVQVLRTQQEQARKGKRHRSPKETTEAPGKKQASLGSQIHGGVDACQNREGPGNELRSFTAQNVRALPEDRGTSKIDAGESYNDKRENAGAPPKVTIVVSRVSLDDPIMQHRQQWKSSILPRLRSFAEAVYSIRSDDGKRYRMLMAVSDVEDQSGAWRMLFDECPWLKTSDTAFNNDRV
jgi:hypothetical protein